MREFVCGYQTLITCTGEILGVVLLLLVFGLVAVISIGQWWKQARCKHNGGVSETRECDAICRNCGKNLGFIGTWRDKQTAFPAQFNSEGGR